jgi:hypothetical protein
VPFVRGGCKEQIMEDEYALECFMKIGYKPEAGTVGSNISSVDGIAQSICRYVLFLKRTLIQFISRHISIHVI